MVELMELQISQDGTQMCVLFGENLQEGIAGFGNTVPEALIDFANNYAAEYGN